METRRDRLKAQVNQEVEWTWMGVGLFVFLAVPFGLLGLRHSDAETAVYGFWGSTLAYAAKSIGALVAISYVYDRVGPTRWANWARAALAAGYVLPVILVRQVWPIPDAPPPSFYLSIVASAAIQCLILLGVWLSEMGVKPRTDLQASEDPSTDEAI